MKKVCFSMMIIIFLSVFFACTVAPRFVVSDQVHDDPFHLDAQDPAPPIDVLERSDEGEAPLDEGKPVTPIEDGTATPQEGGATQEESLVFFPLDDGTIGVMLGQTEQSSIAVPHTYRGQVVSTILPSAFADAAELVEIDLPDTLTTIASGAFAGCNALTTVYLPDREVSIAEDAFDGCFATMEYNYFEASYRTESYVEIGATVELLAIAHIKGSTDHALVWQSLDPAIATVSPDGVVTGVAEGYATIRVCSVDRPSMHFDFGVTVYGQETSQLVKTIILANNSNIEWTQLGIGSGTPAYDALLIESIGNILYNDAYTENTDYESIQETTTDNHGGNLDGVEFITVHYTGNMNTAAGAQFHARYFANGTGGTSIHYVVGNEGIYHILDNGLIAYHAGDGASTASKLVWLDTGIRAEEGDPLMPEWGISKNSKYTLNGVETSIDVPQGTTEATKRVTESRWINKMGFAYKIVDGEYYMAKTWWCYSQVAEGRLCTRGGNRTSIGIETCVNQGSDLWYTWHLTAKLVARLMQTYDLPIDRVVGHHFFTAKDCPQPMLENDMALWQAFRKCVQAEYDLLTLQADTRITMTFCEDYDGVDENGRVHALPERSRLVRYQVCLRESDGTEKVITLAAMLNK